MRINRISRPSGDDGYASAPAEGGTWNGLLPALAEFLTAVRWENGDVRVPGSLTLFTDNGLWKVCLSDKDSGSIAFCTSDSPEGALFAANKGLETGSLDWRAQRDRNSNKRR